MKNTNRILSVLLCVALVLSFANSFVLALGGASGGAAADGTQAPAVVGAAPDYTGTLADDAQPVVTEDDIAAATTVFCVNGASGSTVDVTWKGTTYPSLEVGSKVFASLTDINTYQAAGHQIDMVLFAGAWNLGTGGQLIFEFPAKYYTEDYNISAVGRGTAEDGSDWGAGAGYLNKFIVGTLTINSSASDGTYEFSGFTLRGRLFNAIGYGKTTGRSDIILRNTVYYPGTNVECIFDSRYAQRYQRADNTDSIYIKDFYIFSSISALKLFYGSVNPAYLTIDTMLYRADVNGNFNGDIYVRTNATTGYCTIKNSCIRNHTASFFYWNGGNNGSDNASGDFALNFENNIFYKCGNASHSLRSQLIGCTSVNLIGNTFYGNGSPVTRLFYGSDSTVNDRVAAGTLSFTITDNKFYDYRTVSGGIDVYPSPSAAASFIVKHNYALEDSTATTVGQELKLFHGTLADGDNSYYFDSAMTTLNTDLNVTSIVSNNAAVTVGAIDHSAGTVSLSFTGGSSSDLTVTVPAGTTYGWYSDAGCTSPAIITFDDSAYGAHTYYLKTTKGGFEKIYTVSASFLPNNVASMSELSADTNGDFSESTAVFLDSRATGGNGTHYYVPWNGKMYDAVIGTNVFATQDALVNAGKSDKAILVAYHSGNFTIAVIGGKYYTPAYNICPYIKGSAADGSDWTANPAFDAKSVAVDIVNAGWKGGPEPVEMYGFTVTQYFDFRNMYHTAYDAATTIKLVNTRKVTGSGTGGANLFYCIKSSGGAVSDPGQLGDTLYVENFYIQGNDAGRFFDNFYPANTTFDGMFVDFEEAGAFSNGAPYLQTPIAVSSFTIKNSNIRNLSNSTNIYAKLWFQGYTGAEENFTCTLNFDNNILFNFVTRIANNIPYLINWYPSAYTACNFTDNLVILPSVFSEREAMFYNNGTGATTNFADGSVVITDNRMLGAKTTFGVTYASGYDPANLIDLRDNFITDKRTIEEAATAVGKKVYISTGTFAGSPRFWLDYAMTESSSVIYPATFNTTVDLTSATEAALETNGNSINISALIAHTGYSNAYRLYSDEDHYTEIEDLSSVPVPSGGRTVYLQVCSPDEVTSRFVTITITRDSEFVAGIAVADPVKALDDGIHNQISWRGIITAQGDYALELVANESALNDASSESRVGMIYLSRADGNGVDYDAFESALKEKITELDGDVDAAVAQVNASFAAPGATYVKAYALDSEKRVMWNDERHAYTYVYRFNVTGSDKTRYAIAYVAYVDDSGTICVEFSDVNMQTSAVKVTDAGVETPIDLV